MASLQGLPPLPRSLRGLLHAGSAHWRETEKIHAMKASIQQDLASGQQGMGHGDTGSLGKTGSPRSGKFGGIGGLQAALAHLRREMVSLRQLDMSLLCQLWGLNESLQDYKHQLHDRTPETNSECSSYGLENGLDGLESIPSIEEENSFDEEHIYENVEPESMYMEPVSRPSLDSSLKSGQRQWNGKGLPFTSYESAC